MSERKGSPGRFVKMPIWLAVRASKVCKSTALLLVLTHMLDRAFEESGTFRLTKRVAGEARGQSEDQKSRAARPRGGPHNPGGSDQ